MSRTKDTSNDWMIEAYNSGKSCYDIAFQANMSRQAVYDILQRRNVVFRQSSRLLKSKDIIQYNGCDYAWCVRGYWRKTNGDRSNLTRNIWENNHPGEKLGSRNVYYQDGNKHNLNIDNLVAMDRAEYQKIRLKDPKNKELLYANSIIGRLTRCIRRETEPGYENAIARKMWETRRKRYSSEEISQTAQKIWATRISRYGHSGCKSPEEARTAMRLGNLNSGGKTWETRRKRYGQKGHKNQSKE